MISLAFMASSFAATSSFTIASAESAAPLSFVGRLGWETAVGELVATGVGGTVGGTSVAVGGTGVAAGTAGVAVGETGVAAGTAGEQAARLATRSMRLNSLCVTDLAESATRRLGGGCQSSALG